MDKPPSPLEPATPPAEPVPIQPVPPAEPELETAADRAPSAWREVLSTLGILVLAVLVAVALIAFVFRSYQVDGPSMETALQNQDKLIIWKVPRTWARITGHPYIPKRGDVVVFQQSGLSAFGQDDSKQLIKRVLGLPGDHVVVKDGVLTIYNKQHAEGFQPDQELDYNKDQHIPATTGNVDVTLAAGQLFVCGDNRPDSLDSRTFGPIKADEVIGQLVVRIYPLNGIKAF